MRLVLRVVAKKGTINRLLDGFSIGADHVRKTILFMHIPKTAGSALNEMFATIFGRDNCEFFAEEKLSVGYSLAEICKVKLFVSGHFSIREIREVPRESCVLFTVLRNPLERVISHIHWVDHYNNPEIKTQKSAFPSEVIELIETLDRTDINDPVQLSNFLREMSPLGLAMFDNCQTRSLLDNLELSTCLNLNHGVTASDNVKYFDLVWRPNHFDILAEQVIKKAGHEIKVPLYSKTVNKIVPRRTILREKKILEHILSSYQLSDYYLYSSAFPDLSH